MRGGALSHTAVTLTRTTARSHMLGHSLSLSLCLTLSVNERDSHTLTHHIHIHSHTHNHALTHSLSLRHHTSHAHTILTQHTHTHKHSQVIVSPSYNTHTPARIEKHHVTPAEYSAIQDTQSELQRRLQQLRQRHVTLTGETYEQYKAAHRQSLSRYLSVSNNNKEKEKEKLRESVSLAASQHTNGDVWGEESEREKSKPVGRARPAHWVTLRRCVCVCVCACACLRIPVCVLCRVVCVCQSPSLTRIYLSPSHTEKCRRSRGSCSCPLCSSRSCNRPSGSASLSHSHKTHTERTKTMGCMAAL